MKYKCTVCGYEWGRTLCIHDYVHCPKCTSSCKEESARIGEINNG